MILFFLGKREEVGTHTSAVTQQEEQQEQHEADKLQRETDYIEAMTTYVESWRVEYTASISKRTVEELRSLAERYRSDRICEDLFTREFEDRILAASVYADAEYKARAFTYDQYRELPAEVKTVLRNAYNGMNLTSDDLKN